MIMHARSLESVRPLSNDERRAIWARRYFLRGHHRNPQKPRIKITVPAPLATNMPSSRAPSCVPPAHSGWSAF